MIQPSVTNGRGGRFDDLLKVMEDSDYQGVKELTKQIRDSLRDEPIGENDNG